MLLLTLIVIWAFALAAASKCGLYLIPSTIQNAGRGIAAGISYESEFEIESNPTLPIPKTLTRQTQLTHYVYGTGNDRYDMMMIGPASIYNHHEQRTVYYSWKDHDVPDPSLLLTPHANFTHTVFRTSRKIKKGSELFNFYGEKWFDRFDSSHYATGTEQSSTNTSRKFTTDDFKRHGHCLTHVIIRESNISGAGLGLFTTKRFDEGEIVSLSPVLSLSKSVVEQYYQETVLMNYCFAVPNSNVVLFPFNYGAMINHNSTGANVKVEWFDWSPAVEALAAKYHADVSSSVKNQNLRMSDKLQMTVRELYTAPFAQLDMAYRATRPIAKGEEILVDYGPAWEAVWDVYKLRLQTWNVMDSNEKMVEMFPLFRSFMAAPEGLFPPRWMDPLGGEDTDANEKQCIADKNSVDGAFAEQVDTDSCPA